MYLSTDDARSDFFLAAAVYVVGPLVLSFLLGLLGPLLDGGVGQLVVAVSVPFLLVAAMPLYLMRYRGEPWSVLTGGTGQSVQLGLVLGGLVALGTLLGDLVAGNQLADGIVGTFAEPAIGVGRVVEWLSFAVLTVFLWRRAEYAFRPISEETDQLVTRSAAATIGGAVAASLLLTIGGAALGLALAPLGFAAAFAVARRMVPPAGVEERWRIYAPLITLALGPLSIFTVLGNPTRFLIELRTAGMLCAFGLLIIMGLQRGRGGRFALVLGAMIALLTSVTVFIGGLV